MKAKPRWMKSVIATAADDKTQLPFQRGAKAEARETPLKKVASA